MVACHLFACVWYLNAINGDYLNNWVYRNHLNQASNFEKYLSSLYWVVQTVITVGYGDIGAYSSSEQIISIMAMFTGVAFFSLTVGTLTNILANTDTRRIAYEGKMATLIHIREQFGIKNKIFEAIERILKYGAYKQEDTY